MLFRELREEDKEWLTQAFWEDQRKACEFSFANNYLWDMVYHVQVAECHGCAILRYVEGEETVYVFPCGAGDKFAALQEMLAQAEESGGVLKMTGVIKEETEYLQQHFPDVFQIETDRDDYDYIYNTQDLIHLSGKKYHGKRNHIARFKDTPWAYEEMGEENLEECQQMLAIWKQKRDDKWDDLMEEEYHVVQKALREFGRLDLQGGLIRQKGEVVAFTMGEPLTKDTYVVHFEKAFPEIQGAYPIINQQFVEHTCQAYAYVNREEDDGEEGLRRAKLSYHPAILLEKFRVTQKK